MELATREKISYIWRIIFMIVAWSNLLLMLFVRIFVLETVGSLFLAIIKPYRYYTIQTNLIVSIWFTLSVIFQKKPEIYKKINGFLKGAIMLYISITFLIYAIFLDNLYTPDSWHSWIVDVSTHYVVPISFIIGWAIDIGEKYRWISLIYGLIYPICYIGFALIHGTISGDYLYPFFNIVAIGIGGFFMWFFILLGIYLILGAIAVGINRLVWKSREKNSV